ncbi:hypothetical protein D3C72_1340130 [compost metagenome]
MCGVAAPLMLSIEATLVSLLLHLPPLTGAVMVTGVPIYRKSGAVNEPRLPVLFTFTVSAGEKADKPEAEQVVFTR